MKRQKRCVQLRLHYRNSVALAPSSSSSWSNAWPLLGEVHTPSMDLVVDITADQFGGDQVVFLPLEQSHQYINGQQDLIDEHVIQIRKLFFSSVGG